MTKSLFTRRLARLASGCAALVLGLQPSHATITVTNLADSGPGSLRDAIAKATSGETISCAVTGTIFLTNGQLVLNKSLSLVGPGAPNLTLSGRARSRVINVQRLTTNLISGLTITDGLAYDGAGLRCEVGAALRLANCIVSSNQASFGGGLWNGGGAVVIGCTFQQNMGTEGAGAWNRGQMAVTNCTFYENWATDNGGGFEAAAGSAVLASCTLAANFAGLQGGGVWVQSGTLLARSTLVAGNKSPVGPDGFTAPGASLASANFNLIQYTNGITITGTATRNLYGFDPLMKPLSDNGGATPTCALVPGSPAIDAGDAGGSLTDQRGSSRPYRFASYPDASDGADIGAYELQEQAQPGPIFTVNSTDDLNDGTAGAVHCSLREALFAANRRPGTNTILFLRNTPEGGPLTGLITLTNGMLVVTNHCRIEGSGSDYLGVNGNRAGRVFWLSNATVGMRDLSIIGGRLTNGNGAGVNVVGGALTLDRCTVAWNTNLAAAAAGGGIASTGATVVIRGTRVFGNDAHAVGTYGGGVAALGGRLELHSSALYGNTGQHGAGAYSSANTAVTNCTVSGNYGLSFGAGLDLAGTAVIASSTICSNYSEWMGGGLCQMDINYPLRLANSIVAGNYADWNGSEIHALGVVTSLDYNLIQDAFDLPITGATNHNLLNVDARLGPLAELGGPTPSHALWFDSPALDTGQSSGLTTDQRGVARPLDDPGIPNAGGGDSSDIGAYEANPFPDMVGIRAVGVGIMPSFISVLGHSYRLEVMDGEHGTWRALQTGVPGNGGTVGVLDSTTAGVDLRFYRAALEK